MAAYSRTSKTEQMQALCRLSLAAAATSIVFVATNVFSLDMPRRQTFRVDLSVNMKGKISGNRVILKEM